ncbi:MAG: DUF2157 domain-containing protein [Pedobacter sp.]|uniref:DUF2157 domain-containing protein n=1 Tax=Pedobacter sp. TaxID=1411316 RepID=UPI002809C750|nr:DUF2157 domain-containing protein [Pedobacter sp.]MDQ8005674.1 DUF2157 domain-containing protein [Pedobacter sp.]
MKKIDQDNSDFLDEMLDYWQSEKLLTEAEARKLKNSYEPKAFDWRRLAQYSFWIAMACGVIALSALLVDKSLLDYLKNLYNTPNIVISIVSALAATGCYILGVRRKKKKPQNVFSNEAIIFSGVMLTANAVAYLGKAIDNGSNHFSLLILFSVIIYLALAYFFKSRLIWAFALLALGAWFGTETGYLSKWNWYFLGLNYPLRFVFFGLLLTASSLLLKRGKQLAYFFDITYFAGLLYLFSSLLLLSIFGNYGTLEDWYLVKQITLFYWAIISSTVCVLAIIIGLKCNDAMLREFGIIFLFINLYTRYFEYFWDSWHKAIFFTILGISFVLIGRKAEKIWSLEFMKK